MQNKLYKIAYNILKNEEDALDAIQETIVMVYNNMNKIEYIESFENWVITILYNECKKIYRKNKKTVFLDISKNNGIDDIDCGDLDSSLNFYELIKNLSIKEQNILILYYQNDCSIKDISKILNMKINTVKSIMKRAKEKIEKELRSN